MSAAQFYGRAAWLLARWGRTALKSVIAAGQYTDPPGLFYGGSTIEEGPQRLDAFVRDRFTTVRCLVGLDVHTGLGPWGVDSLIVGDAPESKIFRIMRATFGGRVVPAGVRHLPGSDGAASAARREHGLAPRSTRPGGRCDLQPKFVADSSPQTSAETRAPQGIVAPARRVALAEPDGFPKIQREQLEPVRVREHSSS